MSVADRPDHETSVADLPGASAIPSVKFDVMGEVFFGTYTAWMITTTRNVANRSLTTLY